MVSASRGPHRGEVTNVNHFQTPFRQLVVTATAAASIVSNTVAQTFQAKPKVPAQKPKKARPDVSKSLPLIRRAPPVYSTESPSRFGADFKQQPYEVKEQRVRIARIKRRESGSDGNLEKWVEHQARLEEAEAKVRAKSRSKRVKRHSSGASIQKHHHSTAYDVLLLDTHGVRGRRSTQQLSVRNRTIDEIHHQAIKNLKDTESKSKRTKNKWESSSMKRVKAAEDVELLERYDAQGNLLPPPESNEDSILAAAKRKEPVKHIKEPRDRYTNRKAADSLPFIPKAYVQMPPGPKSRIRRQNSGTDTGLNDQTNTEEFQPCTTSRRHSGKDRKHRKQRKQVEYSSSTSSSSGTLEEAEKETSRSRKHGSTPSSSKRRHRSKVHETLTRRQGGSVSVLGRDSTFQPDFYHMAPALNLELADESDPNALSPSVQARLLQCLAEKEPALLKLAERLTIQQSQVKAPSPKKVSSSRHSSRTSPRRQSTNLRSSPREGTKAGSELEISQTSENPSSRSNPREIRTPTDTTMNPRPLKESATREESGNNHDTDMSRESNVSIRLDSQSQQVGPKTETSTLPPYRESISAFMFEEKSKPGVECKQEEAIKEDKMYSPKQAVPEVPKLQVKWSAPTTEREEGFTNDEESDFKSSMWSSLWDTFRVKWADFFYEEPGPESEGRPFFSFIPILGYPLHGEDKWATDRDNEKLEDFIAR